jgi:uncharacterized protein (DUF1684 family)
MRREIIPRWPLFLLLTTLAPAAARGTSPAAARSAPDSITAAIIADRKDTEDWLRSKPSSYLAAVSRVDFEQRATLTLGGAPGNDVRLRDSTIAPHHLSVTVVGDSFRVEAIDPEARFTVGDAEVRAATLSPRTIGVGRYQLRLSHQRYPALIVFDPRSRRFAEFKGPRYYPVDLAYRLVLPFQPNPRPDTMVIISTRGNQRRAVVAGWFGFTLGGTKCRLEATRLLEPGVGEHDFSIFFRDATTGKDTYGVGRYVEPVQQSDGRYVIDFNNAYNPACAFSDYYNCPIPPKGNTLKVAIRAGEMDAHYLSH